VKATRVEKEFVVVVDDDCWSSVSLEVESP
jgi:hypothetical protein